MQGLHTLHPATNSRRRRIRIGRGNASSGNYSGKGMKGQRARAGGRRGLRSRSMKQYLLRIPKVRGFKVPASSHVLVNLMDLQKHFNEGDTVTIRKMIQKKLVPGSTMRVKVLGGGKLSKKLIINAHGFSAEAKRVIESVGGSANVSKSGILKETAKDRKKAT